MEKVFKTYYNENFENFYSLLSVIALIDIQCLTTNFGGKYWYSTCYIEGKLHDFFYKISSEGLLGLKPKEEDSTRRVEAQSTSSKVNASKQNIKFQLKDK